MLIRGGCHCGNISFMLDWRPEPSEIPARACDCSFCTKHGGVWTSNPKGALRVQLKDPKQFEVIRTKYADQPGVDVNNGVQDYRRILDPLFAPAEHENARASISRSA